MKLNYDSFLFCFVNNNMNCDVKIKETAKTVEIRDNKDNLKWKVVLQPFDDGQRGVIYIVKVLNSYNEEVMGETYATLRFAEIGFAKCVKNYTFLVKAESKPIDNIKIYADKIKYRKIDPDCCMNCLFCRKKYQNETEIPYGKYELVCVNAANFNIFDVFPPDCECDEHDSHGFKPNHRPKQLKVRPKVDFNGLCERYIRREPKPDCENITVTFQNGDTSSYQISATNIIGLDKYIIDTIDAMDGVVDDSVTMDMGGA